MTNNKSEENYSDSSAQSTDQQTLQQNPGTNNQIQNSSGTYTLPATQSIRTDSGLNTSITGQVNAGYTVKYDGVRNTDGYNWYHYQKFAIQDRWIADLNTNLVAPDKNIGPGYYYVNANYNDYSKYGNFASYTQNFINQVTSGAILYVAELS